MQKLLFILFIFLLIPLNLFRTINNVVSFKMPEPDHCRILYNEIGLQNVIPFEAFEQAIAGYKKIEDKKKQILTLIDYSKPSTEERMYVIDMNKKRLLYKSLVSHGRNSGSLYATSFSNKNGSYQSSLGFFLTESTYQGKNGYSLILQGLEKGINDKAKQRAIVIHGAPYSNPEVIRSSGRLGRSLGCPALPQKVSKEIIDAIKDGSLIFIYADDEEYLAESLILADDREFT